MAPCPKVIQEPCAGKVLIGRERIFFFFFEVLLRQNVFPGLERQSFFSHAWTGSSQHVCSFSCRHTTSMTRGLYTLKREIKETQEHELLYRRDAEMLMPFFIVNCRTLCSSFKSVFVFLGMSWLSPSQLSEVQENFMESKSVYCSLESER